MPLLVPKMLELERHFLQVTAMAAGKHLLDDLSLTFKTEKISELTAGSSTLVEGLMKFAPIFQRMHDVIASIEASEKKRLVAQKRIDKADVAIQLLDNDADDDNPFDFLSEW